MRKYLPILVFLLFFPLVFASVTQDNIILELLTSGNDVWSPPLLDDTFNFTIRNQNSSYSFNKINITIPQNFNITTMPPNISLNTWACTLELQKISCDSTTPISNGNSINIWFNATSPSTSTELNANWVLDLINETLVKTMTITSWIDGKLPAINNISMTYNGSILNDNESITQRSNITLTVNATDTGIGLDKVWVKVYSPSKILNQTIILENISGVFYGNITTNELTNGTYNISVFANDSYNNSNSSLNYTFRLNPLPDFSVENFVLNPNNPYPGQELNVFSTISNIGKADYTGNIILHWNKSSELICNKTIENLFIGQSKEVNCIFSNFNGENIISLIVDPDNLIDEISNNNNNRSQTVSTNLNVTILNVKYNGNYYNNSNPAHVNYNDNIFINVSVKYWNNNTPITGLSISNFNPTDSWSSGSNDRSNRTSIKDSSLNSAGIYLLEYKVPDISNEKLEYGAHDIKIKVEKANYLTESSIINYFMDGPDLVVNFVGISGFNLDEKDNINFSVSVTNSGNKTIYGVNLTSINNTSPGTLTIPSECYSANKQVDQGSTVKLCDIIFKSSESGESKITAVVNGTYDGKLIEYYRKNYPITIDPKKTSSTPPEDSKDPVFDSGKGGLSSSPKTAAAKTSDYLKIDSFPEKVELQQGERKTVTVNVNNVDDFEFQDVALKVTGIDSSWITVIPAEAAEIEPLKSQEYRVVFEIPEDSEIKDYDGVFEASSQLKTQKQSFVLSVLPGPELQAAINQTVQDYQNQIQQLENEISGKKSKGYNTTEAEQKLQELKDEFNKVLSYKDEGNYKSVYGMLNNTGSLLNQTSSLLSGAFALSAQPLAGIAGSEGILFGLLALLLGAGTYTFWGRHFKIKERIAGKVMAKKNEKPWSRDLDIILKKAVNGQKAAEDKPRTEEVKPQVSERMRELNAIKSLAVKGK